MIRRHLPALAAMVWLGAPCALPASLLVQAPTGGGGLWLDETALESCVRDREGRRLGCWPRERGRVTDLRETTRGWIAVGHGRGLGDRDLFVQLDRGAGVESLESPPSEGNLRGRPEVITDGARLLGLAWLEGATQDELEVRVAEWLGDAWGAPVTVSPKGRGSQVAPVATVLDDGRWLLLWTAFDGHDDETVWSIQDDGRWSLPTRVHEDNATPDVVPVLLATPRGAIAAWSWFDGRDYKLRTAFFDGSSWRLDPPYAGRGGLEPHLASVSGTFLLSFMTVVPNHWVACELDELGHLLHRTSAPREPGRRPVVDFAGNGVTFRWFEAAEPREVQGVWEREP